MLNENNIFFNNLNCENILIDMNDSPMLTNFLCSIYINSDMNNGSLQKYMLEYNPSYDQLPIEIHAISYIFHNKLISLSMNDVMNIVNDLISNNDVLNNFSENVKRQYYDDGIAFLNNYVNKNIDEIISKMMLYFKTWDNYALSMLYLQIMTKIYKSTKNNKFIFNFIKLLLKNINFHPEKRVSLKNTKIVFCKLLNSFSKSECEEIIKAI